MMSVKQKDIEYFIEDFERNCTVELVEGQEKNELEKIAEARGMKIKGSRDLGMLKTIYAFTNRPNDNGAILPQNELLKILPQIIGKPMTYNHERRYVIGHYIDYRYMQKEKTVITYAVFYKSHFKSEWKEAKKLFKTKKLSSSFEIWNSKKLRKYFADGTFEMRNMEIAGGALVFQDDKNQPAFEGSDVLIMASRNTGEQSELVYAKKYNEEDIVGSNQWKKSIEKNKQKLEAEKTPQPEVDITETPKEEAKDATTSKTVVDKIDLQPTQIVEPAVPKVICSNCKEEFETIEVTNIKCPKCFAIINKTGEMLYPPQVTDFRIECPNCSMRDWLITKNEEDKSEIRCKSCAKDYIITFAQEEKSEMLDKIKFLYVGRSRCPQCGNHSTISGASDYTQREITCTKCGLLYNVDTNKVENSKTIKSIVEKSLEERRKEEVNKETENKKAEEKEVEVEKTATPIEEDITVPKDNKEVQIKSEEPVKEVITKSSINKEDITTPDSIELEIADIPKGQSESEDTQAEPIEEASQEESIEVIEIEEDLDEILDESKKITTEEIKRIPDSLFAVVKTVKNEVTEKPRKIRMFPINDKDHVRNALDRLPQATKTLEKLGVNIRPVRAKILRRARTLGMTALLDRHKTDKAKNKKTKKLYKALHKAVAKIAELKKAIKLETASITAKATKSKDLEIAKIKKQADEKIKFYKANATLIVARREELGKYAENIEDKDIVNDDVFVKVKLEKENASLRAKVEGGTDSVGEKSSGRDEKFYENLRKDINTKAFNHSK